MQMSRLPPDSCRGRVKWHDYSCSTNHIIEEAIDGYRFWYTGAGLNKVGVSQELDSLFWVEPFRHTLGDLWDIITGIHELHPACLKATCKVIYLKTLLHTINFIKYC